MTENEDIEKILYMGVGRSGLENEPSKIAKALNELMVYRAIGTVEEIHKKLAELDRWHTDKINGKIKNPFAYTSTSICHNCDHKDDYIEELEAELGELQTLKEKSVAKKPYCISEIDDNDNAMVECPICHANSDYSVNTIKRGYCWKCGQKLDWSE